ncbi:MAG: RagB/SusD family nutrient uptake outer membrane protein [Butyricimonas faecihominis]
MWQGAYKSIANCNNLIQNIDKADVTKFLGREGEKNMLKGEALALRAFLHFDLLRLFAPVAVELNGDKTGYVPVNDNNEYLPYCETHPAMFQKRENVQGYLDKVIRDLKDAKTLLATFDTVSSVRKDQLRTTNRLLGTAGAVEDLFYERIQDELLAATAMLARVYNYKGELQLAAEQAQEVIDNRSFQLRDYTSPQYEDVILH